MIRALQQGSRIAIVSPAAAAREELIDKGVANLNRFGYEALLMPHAKTRGPLYYAGTVEERIGDLHAAFADSDIDAILCTRGGWGSAELLPHLDLDLIRANAKPFIGYSDHTSLQSFFWSTLKLPSLYGPMCAADWSLDNGVDEPTWRSAVQHEGSWHVGKNDGLRVLREGRAEGRLLGGCLAILEASLGTPYALCIDEPAILFLEDINVKPYQWDRMIQHLRFAGLLANVQGIVLGDMDANVMPDEMPLLEAACLHALGDFQGPVSIGLRSGHVRGGNRSLPLGTLVALDNDTLRSL